MTYDPLNHGPFRDNIADLVSLTSFNPKRGDPIVLTYNSDRPLHYLTYFDKFGKFNSFEFDEIYRFDSSRKLFVPRSRVPRSLSIFASSIAVGVDDVVECLNVVSGVSHSRLSKLLKDIRS